MPETPYWYMLKNKKSKAIESLMWLRKEDEAKVYYEINEIEKNLDGINTHIPTFLEIIVNPKWWKTFLFYSTYLLLSELSGYDMIIPYSLQFFAKFNQSQVDNQIVATIFLSSAFAGAIITACITEKFKRISLVKSGLISNMLLLIFSGYCSTQPDSLTYYIISLICLCLYASNISIVLLGLPYTIMAERLPTEFRAKIFSSLTSVLFIIYFLFLQFSPTILLTIPVNYILWSFASFSLLNYIFVNNFFKETKVTTLPNLL